MQNSRATLTSDTKYLIMNNSIKDSLSHFATELLIHRKICETVIMK